VFMIIKSAQIGKSRHLLSLWPPKADIYTLF
jgi:hypothetical protein